MNRYELAVFDLDGTLLDTTEGVLSAVRDTITELGLAIPPKEILLGFIGPPIQDSFARTFGLEGEILQEIATLFRNQYCREELLLLAKPYDGIFDLLEELCQRGIRPAVATYKREDYALRLLSYFGFNRYTEIMFGGDHENTLKKKDIIERCLSVGGVPREHAVMIGDTAHDAVGANAAGVDFLGVTYGFGFRCAEDVAKCPSVGSSDTPLGLLKFFKKNR